MTILSKNSKIIAATISLLLMCSIIACQQDKQNDNATEKSKTEVELMDYGPSPLVLDVEAATLNNTNFRMTLWTGKELQVALMSIPVGGEIGLEQHICGDQFIRIEEGKAQVLMGDSKESLTFNKTAEDDFAIFIPAGQWHIIINIGDKPLKIYSIYAPVEHPHSTIHKTFEEAEEAEAEHHK